MASNAERLIQQLLKNLEAHQKREELQEVELQQLKDEITRILNDKNNKEFDTEDYNQLLNSITEVNQKIGNFQDTFKKQERQPKIENVNYNKMISEEIGQYRWLVGWGTFSRIYRTKDPKRTWEILNTPTEQGGYYILIEWLQWYVDLLGGDSAEEKAQTANIVYKLEDMFESFLYRLEEEGLL